MELRLARRYHKRIIVLDLERIDPPASLTWLNEFHWIKVVDSGQHVVELREVFPPDHPTVPQGGFPFQRTWNPSAIEWTAALFCVLGSPSVILGWGTGGAWFPCPGWAALTSAVGLVVSMIAAAQLRRSGAAHVRRRIAICFAVLAVTTGLQSGVRAAALAGTADSAAIWGFGRMVTLDPPFPSRNEPESIPSKPPSKDGTPESAGAPKDRPLWKRVLRPDLVVPQEMRPLHPVPLWRRVLLPAPSRSTLDARNRQPGSMPDRRSVGIGVGRGALGSASLLSSSFSFLQSRDALSQAPVWEPISLIRR